MSKQMFLIIKEKPDLVAIACKQKTITEIQEMLYEEFYLTIEELTVYTKSNLIEVKTNLVVEDKPLIYSAIEIKFNK